MHAGTFCLLYACYCVRLFLKHQDTKIWCWAKLVFFLLFNLVQILRDQETNCTLRENDNKYYIITNRDTFWSRMQNPFGFLKWISVSQRNSNFWKDARRMHSGSEGMLIVFSAVKSNFFRKLEKDVWSPDSF